MAQVSHELAGGPPVHGRIIREMMEIQQRQVEDLAHQLQRQIEDEHLEQAPISLQAAVHALEQRHEPVHELLARRGELADRLGIALPT